MGSAEREEGITHAPDGQVWVCGACGKTSRTRYGWDHTQRSVASPGWDASCMTWAVLCHAERDPDGSYRAVESGADK